MKFIKILACVLAITLFAAQGAMAELKMSASTEWNTDFYVTSDDATDTDTTVMAQGGRVKLVFEGLKNESETGLYFAAKGDVLVQDEATVGIDDSWVEIGGPSWYMRVGRPEATSLFGLGNDTFIVSAPNGPGRYQANYSRGRSKIGAQIDLKASDAMLVESSVMYATNGSNNVVGARPLVQFSASGLTVKGGADYYREMPQNNDAEDEISKYGFGGTAEFAVSDVITVGGSAAYGIAGGKDTTGADLDEETTMSFWGYANLSVAGGTLGGGAGMTMVEYDTSDVEKDHLQAFLGYNKPLSVKGATIKICGSYAAATVDDVDSSAMGVRLRINYDL